MFLLDVDLFMVISSGTLWVSLTWKSVSFSKMGNFSAIIISLNKFLMLFAFLLLLETPIVQMLFCLMFFHQALKASWNFLKFFFHFGALSEWMVPCFPACWSSASSCLLLKPSSVSFSLVIVFFNSVASVWHFLIFSFFFIELLTMFIHSSSKFSEHFCDHYFELCIRHMCVCVGHVWLFAIPWTVAYQASQSIEFSRQE